MKKAFFFTCLILTQISYGEIILPEGYQIEKWATSEYVMTAVQASTGGEFGENVYAKIAYGDIAALVKIGMDRSVEIFTTGPHRGGGMAFDTAGEYGGDLFIMAATPTAIEDILYRVEPTGQTSVFSTHNEMLKGIAFGKGGAFGNYLYVQNGDSAVVKRIAPDGTRSDAGRGSSATGMSLVITNDDIFGNYIYSSTNHSIERIAPDGTVETFYSGDTYEAWFDYGDSFGDTPAIYLKENNGSEINKIDSTGTAQPFLSGLENGLGLFDVVGDTIWVTSGYDLYRITYIPEHTTLILYVDSNAPGANDGSSWQNAYNFLQDALADANSSPKPVEIRVAQGIYTPDSNSADPNGSGSRESTFQLINWVSLKGGYAGFGASDPNERNINCYETILSGDIAIADNNSDNSYHVVTGADNAELNGFTITAGNTGVNNDYHWGGGMYNYQCSPIVTNCTFINNFAKFGGAIYVYESSLIVSNCDFVRNIAMTGGGIHVKGDSLITKCLFADNYAWGGTETDQGGGALRLIGGNSMITYCIFNGNLATSTGGAIRNYQSNTIVANCEFVANSVEKSNGGAIYNNASLTMNNCTFAGNTTNHKGGVLYNTYNTSVTLTNCILWGNLAADGNTIALGPGALITQVSYSNVEGGEDGVYVEGGTLNWGNGNIDIEPNFVDPCNNDYHLQSQAGHWDKSTHSWIKDSVTSPCIDAGDPMSLVGKEQFPNGGRVNMGAYGGTVKASKSYFGDPVCEDAIAGDVDGDCVVGFRDFAIMSFHWLEENKP